MALIDLSDWLGEFSGENVVWYVKRLSANDTLANGSHQYGPYIPKEFLFKIFPNLYQPGQRCPDVYFDLYIDSHAYHRKVRAIWYNNKLHENPESGRNETRITQLGGKSSALLDPENTGTLAVFAFVLDDEGVAICCHVWVCEHETEVELVEGRIGPVDPGKWVIWPPTQPDVPALFGGERPSPPCWLEPAAMPPNWLTSFPTGQEIIHKTVEMRPCDGIDPDKRLMVRRVCEFEIFRSIEEAQELPVILRGFESVGEFIMRAQSILQRRKVRSGRSLELHAREIFLEENLPENEAFSHQPESELGKKPDFLFPSEAAYKDASFPEARLRMLAVKTTCKDRWRQILNEANRIPRKHLLTLQEGVSEAQFREMQNAGVSLVVPSPIISKFPKSVRPHLQSLESFIGDVRLLSL